MIPSWNTFWKRAWRPAAGLAGLAALGLYTFGGCAKTPPPAALEAGEPVPPDAAIVTVRRVVEPGRVEVPGSVESETRIRLSAKIPAHVRSVQVSAGQAVRAGEPVILLDDREIREQIEAAESQLRQAEAEFRRVESLFREGAATEQQRLAAETARNVARSQLERARVMLSYTVIASPIDGVATDRMVEEGDLVGPGQPVLVVYDPNRLRVEAPVPERWIAYVRVGQAVDVMVGQPPETRRATVAEIVSAVDPATRTRLVKASLQDPTGLLPGSFARLVVPTESVEVIRVPEAAVRRVGQLEMVRVVHQGRAVRRLVRTGARRAGQVEILTGLEDGETILVPAGGV